MAHNEIDNMALIMPSQATRLSIAKVESDSQEKEAGKRPGGRRKDKKCRLEAHNSLNVACLKRLVPVGLGFFSGREQELLQQAKQKLLQVRNARRVAAAVLGERASRGQGCGGCVTFRPETFGCKGGGGALALCSSHVMFPSFHQLRSSRGSVLRRGNGTNCN